MSLPLSLETIEIASPCSVSWDSMRGDGRVRFCGECEQRVYNLSGLTRKAAEDLVCEKEGQLCVRFYRREDRKVMTADCPVGAAAALRWTLRKTGAFVGMVAGTVFGLFIGPACVGPDRGSAKARQVEPFATVLDWIDPQPGRCVMGTPIPRGTYTYSPQEEFGGCEMPETDAGS